MCFHGAHELDHEWSVSKKERSRLWSLPTFHGESAHKEIVYLSSAEKSIVRFFDFSCATNSHAEFRATEFGERIQESNLRSAILDENTS